MARPLRHETAGAVCHLMGRGVTDIPGLYFLGLPWMHTWGSASISGIAGDADDIASCIEASITEPASFES